VLQELGSVNELREALIRLRVEGEYVECLIDTGFSGSIALPKAVADKLSIEPLGCEMIELAGGQEILADIALAEVIWLNEVLPVEIIFIDSTDALLGTEMLRDTKLAIDYSLMTVSVSRDV
jgi:clan AA aspartic protease